MSFRIAVLLAAAIATAPLRPNSAEALDHCGGMKPFVNYRRSHVLIRLDSSAPADFKAFRDRALSKPGSFVLDEKGLSRYGKPLCHWLGGDFDAKRADIILENCPADSPLKNGWGDRGVGGAVMCLEVEGRAGDVAWFSFRGERQYLSLANALSGMLTWEEADTEAEAAERRRREDDPVC